MTLPVFVIHWNAPEVLERSLGSLALSTGVDIDVTVIDNASENDAFRAASDRGGARVGVERLERNIGFAGAANRAISLAGEREAPLLAIAAHDIIVRPDTIAALKACMNADPTIGIAGPILMSEDWSTASVSHGVWLGSGRARRIVDPGWSQPDRFVDADWMSGALLLVRRACAEGIGGFWTELFAYYEDVDLCLRARDAGWRVGVWTTARAQEQGTTADPSRHVYLISRNAIAVTRRREGRINSLRGVMRTAVGAGRAFGGSIAPWRTSAQRALSRQFSHGQAWAAIDAVRGHLGPGRALEGMRGPTP